jgi:hypothetical protein
MRIAILVLLLGCAASAMCQSATPSLLSTQPPSALAAWNATPKSRFLTIKSAPVPKAIPTQWPDLYLHAIPVEWPNFNLTPVQSGAPTASQPLAKLSPAK